MAEPNRKKSRKKEKNSLTPEQVIAEKLRHLADVEDIYSFFGRLIAMSVLLGILFGVFFGVTPMRNDDMKPRLNAGDLMLYYRLEKNLRVQDVIIFEKDGISYTGRIVAQSGDQVEITEDSCLMVNESLVFENDIYYSTPRYESEVTYPVSLGSGQYFVLCDYREGAKDSRYFGAVDMEEIRGKVITVIRRSGL